MSAPERAEQERLDVVVETWERLQQCLTPSDEARMRAHPTVSRLARYNLDQLRAGGLIALRANPAGLLDLEEWAAAISPRPTLPSRSQRRGEPPPPMRNFTREEFEAHRKDRPDGTPNRRRS